MPDPSLSPPPPLDWTLQDRMLAGVSRTFALTIPALPDALHRVVGNAYLLCRIVDTIEDEPALEGPDRRSFAERFVEVVAGRENPVDFARALEPRLTGSTLDTERELVRETPEVIRITHSFSEAERAALERCVSIMAEGMVEFQENREAWGLADQAEMDRYCYYVAGVVGEMLTDLFCLYLPDVLGDQQDPMRELGRSFGQGLQMTNILKDVWADYERGYCWLPREVFSRHGFDLDDMEPGQSSAEFEAGMLELVTVGHGHLRNALEYTLRIPSSEPGIRNFCLWALGMAVLTLRNVRRRPGYSNGSEVKISRREVKSVVALSRMFAGWDGGLRGLFGWAARGVPRE